MISPQQFGFRPGRSTIDDIKELKIFVQGSNCKYERALMIDVQGAFYLVWWPIISSRLKKLKFSTNI